MDAVPKKYSNTKESATSIYLAFGQAKIPKTAVGPHFFLVGAAAGAETGAVGAFKLRTAGTLEFLKSSEEEADTAAAARRRKAAMVVFMLLME